MNQLHSDASGLLPRSWKVLVGMKNHIVTWDSRIAQELIESYYLRIGGFYKSKASLQKKKAYALECLQNVLQQSKILAIVSSYDGSAILNREIQLEGCSFACPEMETVQPKNVVALYAFALTAGDIESPEARVLEQAFYDIGGTAITDAARDLLKLWIQKQHLPECYVSDSFGPGFYGMAATEVRKFFTILDCEKIGLKIMPSGFMIPAKSCVGFYLVTTTKEDLPALDCAHCLGHGKMCNYCKAGRRYL